MSVVLITGAIKNTGRAIAEKFAKEGYDVAITSRIGADARIAAEEIAGAYGVRVKGYEMELSDLNSVAATFDALKRDFGRLDTFVANSAHLGVDLGILNSTPENFDDVIGVNLRGTFFCCQHAAKMMKEQGGGAIVLISSVHSIACIQGRCLYSISKGGLNTLATSIAIECGRYHIRANSVIAGAIRTERWDSLTEEQIAAKRRNWPVGLESTGEDIANAAFYLGTDLSKTVSGTQLVVDSGVLSTLLPFNGGEA